MPTKIIFGLRLSAPAVLVVTGSPKDPAPALRVLHGAGDALVPYAAANKGWQTKLEEGDHLVRIDCDDAQDFDGGLAVTLQGPPAIFISQSPDRKLVAWTATGAGSDPKDPWPPPVAATETTAAWFKDALARSGPVVLSVWRDG